MVNNFDARAFASDFANAINTKDAQKVVAYYAEDAELKDPSMTRAVRGKENIRKNVEQWATAMSEMKIDIREIVQSGDNVAVLFTATARHTGDLELAPGETIPATNKVVALDVAEFMKLNSSGKVTSDHAIFDLASMMIQLGLMPSPDAGKQAKPATQR